MRIILAPIALAAALLAAGCNPAGPAPEGTATAETDATEGGIATNAADASPGATGASAALADANGVVKGTAMFVEGAGGVRVTVQASGMEPGEKGIHIHTVGKCEGPKFTSAGAHWNVSGATHGTESQNGPHIGDLPNITIGATGTGMYDGLLGGATLTGENALLDPDGSAIMIHAKADDYKTDPSGASGDRLVCGVVKGG